MRLTLSLAAAAVILGLLAWWGWDKYKGVAVDNEELRQTIQDMTDQAEKTDKAMLARDQALKAIRTEATEARLLIQEVKGDACTDAPVHPYIDCVLTHTAGPKGQRGDARTSCAHLAGQDEP